MIGITDILDLSARIHGEQDRLADRVRHAKPTESTQWRPATHTPKPKSAQLIALPTIYNEFSPQRKSSATDHAA